MKKPIKNDIKSFYTTKMQLKKLKEKIELLSKQKDKKSLIALEKLKKKANYEVIITDTNLIIKNDLGEEIVNAYREKTSYIKQVENDINMRMDKESHEYITNKYDILFEFQEISNINEETLLKDIKNKEDSLKTLMQAKNALHNYHDLAVKNIESEINSIETSLDVVKNKLLKTQEDKLERSNLLKSYDEHYMKLLENKAKLIELSNIPDIQYSIIQK